MAQGQKYLARVGIGLIITMSLLIGYVLTHYEELKEEQKYRILSHLNARNPPPPVPQERVRLWNFN